jgi:hypothetical protein
MQEVHTVQLQKFLFQEYPEGHNVGSLMQSHSHVAVLKGSNNNGSQFFTKADLHWHSQVLVSHLFFRFDEGQSVFLGLSSVQSHLHFS